MSSQTLSKSKRIKLLYVEDNPSNRNLVRYLLDHEIFEYFEAEDAFTGIEKAKAIIPDIILMDINMVGMSGMEATIKIRQIPSLMKTPIIAVTAKSMEGDRERILAAGCTGYIPKPIDVDTFQDKVLNAYQGEEENLSIQDSIKFLKENQVELVEHLESQIIKLRENQSILKENILELEKKNIALRDAQHMLVHSEKLAATGQLVAGIIHEIRTPLTGIMGYHQLLKLKIKDENQLEYLNHCISAVEKIKNIVSDMLKFARKNDQFTKEYFDLCDVFHSIKGLVNIISKQENIPIDIQMPAEKLMVGGNFGSFEQVIMGLVNNAVYAVKKNAPNEKNYPYFGVIVRGGKISHEKGSVVFFEVADTGTGLPVDVQNKIFEPFFSTKPSGEGTGLGLSISKTIVESFGGEITFTTDEGRGTTFKVSFPQSVLT